MKQHFLHFLVPVLLLCSLPAHANRDWVTFEALQANSVIEVVITNKPTGVHLQYFDKNTNTWKSAIGSSASFPVKVTLSNVGDKVQFRGQNPNGLQRVINSTQYYIKLKATGKVEVSGDILTLVDTTMTTQTMVPTEGCFYRLFEGSTGIYSAEHLRFPKTTYAKCYYEMFYGCNGMEIGPDLSNMEKIRSYSCYRMFYHCTKLKATPKMSKLILVGENGCNGMFDGCTNLTQVDDLTAPYLDDFSYCSMFANCTALENAPRICTDEMHKATCQKMFYNCTKLTNVPDLTATLLDDQCYESMFEKCSLLVHAPAILASELSYTYAGKTYPYKKCFYRMFHTCTRLKSIEVYFTDWSDSGDDSPTSNWVYGTPTTADGIFSAPCGLEDKRGASNIPTKWQFTNCFVCYTFDVETNGGVWKDNGDNLIRTYKDTINVLPLTIKRNAYFVEWNTKADGTGQAWNPNQKPTEHTTYYAIYQSSGEEEDDDFGSCFDYTNFSQAKIDTAHWYEYPKDSKKYYLTPFKTPQESLDYGPRRKFSRYSVHTNPAEVDARTAGELYTTYRGHKTVRLGNWENGCAERITYNYTIPSDKTILLLHYAAILEDPKHEAKEQPRFTLEVKDMSGNPLSECFSFDFVSGSSTGDQTWHVEDDVCWKDWTTMGINLNAYAGQTIQICMTTYDCAQGGHFGYAYFALDCRNGEMKTTNCGASETSSFKAPDGFKYKWYAENEPGTIISEAQTITVSDTKGKTYLCDVINPEKEECYFTLKAVPETRYPLAMYDTVITRNSKIDIITTTNNSCVSNDGVTPKEPRQYVDSCYWELRNQLTGEIIETSDKKNPTFQIEKSGNYELSLQAFLKNGDTGDVCDSEEDVKQFVVKHGGSYQEIPQDTTLCGNDPLEEWIGHTNYVKIDENTYHDSIFSGNPQDTTLYILHITRQMATQKPTTKDAILKGQTYTWRGQTFKATTLETIFAYDTTYYPVTDCDSAYYSLELVVTEHEMQKTIDTTCSNIPYTWSGHEAKYSNLRQGGVYYDTIISPLGDSTFYMLQLTMFETANTTDVRPCTMADFPFQWNGFTIRGKEDDGKIWNGYTIHGCDSTVTLQLQLECQALEATLNIDTICADQEEMYGILRVTAGQATSYSVHYEQHDPQGHFQDLQDIALSGTAEEQITIPFLPKDSINYIRPDDYELTISVKDSCNSQATDFHLTLHVLYPSWIITQRWNDVLALNNEKFNGGYTFRQIEWYKDGQKLAGRGEHNSYLYTGPNEMLDFGTPYWAALVRTGETKSICTCAIKPQKATDNTSFTPMQIVNRQGKIQIKVGQTGEYVIYDICGKMVESGMAEANTWQNTASHLTAGTFVLVFTSEQGDVEVKKFMMN